MTDTISFIQEQGIATLSFDNPARRNALGAAELDAIEAALASLTDETRVFMITSSDDRIFCAGADLNQILDGSISGDRFQTVTNRIAALQIPTIAVLTGNVFGGGAELALSCDFRLAREGISLRIPAAAIGLCYPVEGIERITRRLGPQLARRKPSVPNECCPCASSMPYILPLHSIKRRGHMLSHSWHSRQWP